MSGFVRLFYGKLWRGKAVFRGGEKEGETPYGGSTCLSLSSTRKQLQQGARHLSRSRCSTPSFLMSHALNTH